MSWGRTWIMWHLVGKLLQSFTFPPYMGQHLHFWPPLIRQARLIDLVIPAMAGMSYLSDISYVLRTAVDHMCLSAMSGRLCQVCRQLYGQLSLMEKWQDCSMVTVSIIVLGPWSSLVGGLPLLVQLRGPQTLPTLTLAYPNIYKNYTFERQFIYFIAI